MNIEPSLVIESTTRPVRPNRKRFRLMLVLIWAVSGILIGRSFYLQVIQGSQFRARAEYNRIETAIIPSPRGIVYDRYRNQLVENISSTDLVFDPVFLPAKENEPEIIDALARLLPDTDVEAIQAALDRARTRRQVSLIAKAIPHDLVLQLEEERASIPGTRLVSSLVRKYAYPQATAHILGYTSAVTSQELERDDTLYPTDMTGKQGIEWFYDKTLRGTHGASYIEVNAAGQPQTDLGAVEPVSGQDVLLTIDIEMQDFIHSLFLNLEEETEQTVTGAVVAIDPATGDILALVSHPSYDPNTLSQPALTGQIGDLFQNPAKPLFNRAVDGTFASGSVIKPFIAAAALEEGLITPSTSILSTGAITIGPWRFPDWRAGGHGATNVRKAIAESVNTFFYAITGGYEGQAGLGPERTVEYLRKFGWAERTGVDLPSEAAGFLPSPEWKRSEIGEPWYIGDTYHLGIGQGNVLVTPLQITKGLAGIANGHSLPNPRLVKEDSKPAPLPVSFATVEVIRQGMRETVTEGSGRALLDLPIPLAGKTGTAQVGGTDETHAWFTSFGPYEEPEVALTVLLERGGAGDRDAVPFAKEVWEWWIEHRYRMKE